MIRAESVSYAIGRRTLVRGIDLDLRPGRFVVIVGPNGAGKSTLLRLLTGELNPTSGAVTLDGRDLRSLSADHLARRRAVVAQHTALAFPFTALEVVLLGITVPGLDGLGSQADQLARAMMERLGLSGIAGQLYTTLSGGERQRVHMARALCQLEAGRMSAAEASILVDEPTASLDIAHQLLVLDELSHQKRSGRAVLAVLHDLNLAAAYADEMLLLAEGAVLAAGPASEVMQDARLSAAFGCDVRTNRVPPDGGPFLLPQACSTAASGAIVATHS